MPRLVSRAELARIAKVSAMAITKICRTRLMEACIGPRVDLDHPSVLAYLASKDIAPPAALEAPVRAPLEPTAPRPSSKSASGQREALEASDEKIDVEQYADMTLRQIADLFGTVTAFKDWLDARKKQVAIREKELRNWELEGRLIPRDAVRTHVFGAIDGANRRLLQDAPKTITRRLYAMAKSGAAIEEAEQVVREIVGSQLRPVKDVAARALRSG
jgi:hypothetical protein